jgi:hypothetical protein
MRQSLLFQRIEAATIFAASLFIYIKLDFSILVFILLLFVFDVFMIGYLFNSKIGAYCYNLGHSMIAPPILFAIGFATDARILIGFSLIWLAHIGMDRLLGYGLKFTTGFKETHLGHIGKK